MADDPWKWDVGRVLLFFFTDAPNLISDRPSNSLPRLEEFLTAITDNDVDGETLLESVGLTELKTDFGLAKIKERAIYMNCIRHLRGRSAIYRSRNASSQDPDRWIKHTVQADAEPPSTPITRTIPLPPTSKRETPTLANTREAQSQTQEHQTVDGNGRKRRRIPPSVVAKPTQVTKIDAHCHLPDSALSGHEVFFGSYRFGQEIGEFALPDQITEDQGIVEEDHGGESFQFTKTGVHQGASGFVYNSMLHFFQAEALDVEPRCGEQVDSVVLVPFRDPNVRKRSYRRDMITATRPYVQSALVIQRRGQNLIARREMESLIGTQYPYDEEILDDAKLPPELKDLNQSHHDLAFEEALLTKYYRRPEDDVVISCFSDPDGSAEFSDAGSPNGEINTESEIDSDESGMAEESEAEDITHLSADAVDSIVKQYIKDKKSTWEEQQKPKLEMRTAWIVWKKTRGRSSIREKLISEQKEQIKEFDNRLKKQIDRLTSDQWNEEHLKEVCGTLDSNIEHRQKASWLIEVWKRTKEPQRTVTTRKKGRNDHHSTANGVGPSSHMNIDPEDEILFESTTPIRIESKSPLDATATASDSLPDGIENHADGNEASDEMSVDSETDDFIDAGMEIDQDNTETDIEPDPDTFNEADMAEFQDLTSTPLHPLKSLPNIGRSSASRIAEQSTSSESDLPSHVPAVPRTSQLKKRPSTPSKLQSSRDNVILISSDSSPSKAFFKKSAKTVVISNNPLDASYSDIAEWDLTELASSNDRTRLLMRLLFDLHPKERESIDKVLAKNIESHKVFTASISQIIQLCRECNLHETIPEWLEKHDPATICTRLAVTWFCPRPAALEGGLLEFVQKFMRKIDNLDELVEGQLEEFTKILRRILDKKNVFFSPVGSLFAGSTEKKKQRRELPPNHKALQKQKAAKERQRQAMNQNQSNPDQLQAMISHAEIPINPSSEKPIFIEPHIAGSMKPYQVEGVQFMWREIANVRDEQEGCILAHTMGLGKTLQTITLLVTLEQAAESKDPDIFNLLPQELRSDAVQDGRRKLRILILCPPMLLMNWVCEFNRWDRGSRLGDPIVLEAPKSKQYDRKEDDLIEWCNYGGVLLIGYQYFRSLMAVKDTGTAKEQEIRAEIRQRLSERPELVIADEAHNIKNTTSAVAQACATFDTRSRIALTGTPMSNDVQEIYSLVSWVAPEYLGEQKEFNSTFALPIKDGMYADSEPWAKRKCQVKLAALIRTIDGKIHRAGYSVLKGILPPKIEFIITVALTDEQTELYKAVLDGIRETRTDETSNMQIFQWMSILSLLTAHPVPFKRHMLKPPLKRKKESKPKMIQAVSDDTSLAQADSPLNESEIENEEAIAEPDIFALGFTAATIGAIVSKVQDGLDHNRSAKTAILLDILRHSRSCGDKVLVFSGKLFTLDYIEQLLRQQKFKCCRIDGLTSMKDRERAIRDLKSPDKGVGVMLISTRAGGTGINIQSANRVIVFDYGFNPAHEEQAVGRAYRMGQTKPVFVYRFVSGGTFEAKIYNTQIFKQSLTSRVVDKYKAKRNAKKKVDDYLYPPRLPAKADLEQWKGKDVHVMDLILAHAKERESPGSYIRSLNTMETLQEEDIHDQDLTAEEQLLVSQEVEGLSKLRYSSGAMAPPTTQVPPPHGMGFPAGPSGTNLMASGPQRWRPSGPMLPHASPDTFGRPSIPGQYPVVGRNE